MVVCCGLWNRYVAPRRAAAMYDDEEEEVKKQKIQDRLKRKIEKSQLLKELRSEFSDKPEERKDYNTISNNDVDLEAENKERQDYEEEYMTRLVMSKKGKGRVGGGVQLLYSVVHMLCICCTVLCICTLLSVYTGKVSEHLLILVSIVSPCSQTSSAEKEHWREETGVALTTFARTVWRNWRITKHWIG